MNDIINQLLENVAGFHALILLLTVLVHVFFALGLAKDIGHLRQAAVEPRFVPGSVWVFAVLLGGVWLVLIYWLIHHSTLGRR